MATSNQLFYLAKSLLLGKWFTILAETPDGQTHRTIVYCQSISRYKGTLLIPASKDVLVNGYKIKKAEIFDFGYIDNYVFHYFNSMLRDLTFNNKKRESLFDSVLFTICFNMLLDENLYGDDNKAILDYLVCVAFPRVIVFGTDTARERKLCIEACADIYHELCSSLSIEEQSF